MRIEILSSKLDLPDGIHEHIERRLQFSLSWAAHKIQKITLRLEDINGPKGGVDKSCRIQIGIAGGKPVVIEELQSDLYVAIERAVERAGRALTRRLERTREHSHRRHEFHDVAGDSSETAFS